MADWGSNIRQSASDLGKRTARNVVDGTLTLSDCLGYGLTAAAGYGEAYQGSSQLFKKIYDSPESFGDPKQMRSDMVKDAFLTAGTLGLNRVEESLFRGDEKGVQDALAASLLLTVGAEMGGAGDVTIPVPAIAAAPADAALALEITLAPAVVIPGQMTAAAATLVEGTGIVMMSAEHTKGARPSTQEKHQKGQSRKRADQGGEKADERRGENRDQPRRDRRGQTIEP